LRLAQIENIVGIKDATAGIGARLGSAGGRAPKNFTVYSGDDASASRLFSLALRASSRSLQNVAPRLMHEMCSARSPAT